MITKRLTNLEKDAIGNRLVEKAASFARKAHSDQVRKYTNEPYFVHPERVALRVAAYTGKYSVRAAAYLHDCEAIDLKVLHKEFGPDVVSLVVELTNPSKKFPNLKREARKEMDRVYLSGTSAEAQLIKIIALIDNINSLAGVPEDLQVLCKSESIRLAQSLHKAPQGLVEELIRGCTLIEKS